MHPIGIALAFLVFWSFVAVGGFLLLQGLRSRAFWRFGLSLTGLVLISAGVYASLLVVFAQ